MKSDNSEKLIETAPMRKDSLLEDTMHLKDLDAVSDHYENKDVSE